MLAYAARGPVAVDRKSSPNAMLLIVAAHVGALAVVMSAKMDLPKRLFEPPLVVDSIPAPPPPKPVEVVPPQPEQHPLNPTMSHPDTLVPLPLPGPVEVGTVPAEQIPSPAGGGAGSATGPIAQPPQPLPIIPDRGPMLLTQGSDLKPPYPAAKQAFGEEASLTLKLSIDENGHVLTVDPIGHADRTFAEAARRHIILHWRYRPAIRSGHAVISYTVVQLAFRLDG